MTPHTQAQKPVDRPHTQPPRRPSGAAPIRELGPETIGALLLAAGLGAALRYRSDLRAAHFSLLAFVDLIGAGLLFRRPLSKLFGPVLGYEFLRVSRRGRYILLRCTYVLLLLGLLYWLYPADVSGGVATRFGPGFKQRVDFAERYFQFFMLLQFGMIFLLAPVVAAGSIAEEAERHTLEYLMASDLSVREIILSKLVSRLATLGLVVLAGLPVMSVIQLLGGVEPDLVLAGFAITGASMFSLVTLSIVASVYSRRTRDAILLTFFMMTAYTAVGFLLQQVLRVPSVAGTPIWFGADPPTIETLIRAYNAGNLPIALYDLQASFTAGKSITGAATRMTVNYVVIHFAVGILLSAWAMLRCRPIALHRPTAASENAARVYRPRIRPRLAIRPVVWKEIFVEPGFRLTRVGKLLGVLMVLISLVPAAWITTQYVLAWQAQNSLQYYSVPSWGSEPLAYYYLEFANRMSFWARLALTVLGCLMLLAVAAHASTSISGERDRDTLDALLAAPLQSNDILFAKWLGSVYSVRWAWLWVGIIVLVAGSVKALSITSALLFAVAWLVYASCFAGVGIWFSTTSRTGLRSMIWTLATVVVLSVGPLGATFLCLPLLTFGSYTAELFGVQFVTAPPLVFYHLTAGPEEMKRLNIRWELQTIVCIFGLVFWALGALMIWTVTRRRFRRITSRMPYHRPPPNGADGVPERIDQGLAESNSLRRLS